MTEQARLMFMAGAELKLLKAKITDLEDKNKRLIILIVDMAGQPIADWEKRLLKIQEVEITNKDTIKQDKL